VRSERGECSAREKRRRDADATKPLPDSAPGEYGERRPERRRRGDLRACRYKEKATAAALKTAALRSIPKNKAAGRGRYKTTARFRGSGATSATNFPTLRKTAKDGAPGEDGECSDRKDVGEVTSVLAATRKRQLLPR